MIISDHQAQLPSTIYLWWCIQNGDLQRKNGSDFKVSDNIDNNQYEILKQINWRNRCNYWQRHISFKLSQSFYWLLKEEEEKTEGKWGCSINSKPNAAGLTNRAARSTGGPHFNCMNIQTVMFGKKYSRSILKSPLIENRHKL